MCLLGGVTLARDVAHPFKSRVDAEHTEFAKKFWTRPVPAGWTTLCLTSRRTQSFHPTLCDFSYRIHRATYAPCEPEQFHLEVPPQHRFDALRVVLFKNGDGPVWEGPREWWMHNMRLTHTLARARRASDTRDERRLSGLLSGLVVCPQIRRESAARSGKSRFLKALSRPGWQPGTVRDFRKIIPRCEGFETTSDSVAVQIEVSPFVY